MNAKVYFISRAYKKKSAWIPDYRLSVSKTPVLCFATEDILLRGFSRGGLPAEKQEQPLWGDEKIRPSQRFRHSDLPAASAEGGIMECCALVPLWMKGRCSTIKTNNPSLAWEGNY
jgi:hypothetical protein